MGDFEDDFDDDFYFDDDGYMYVEDSYAVAVGGMLLASIHSHPSSSD